MFNTRRQVAGFVGIAAAAAAVQTRPAPAPFKPGNFILLEAGDHMSCSDDGVGTWNNPVVAPQVTATR
jgi:hypothetical protein